MSSNSSKYMPQQSPIDLGRAERVGAVFPPNYLDLRWDDRLSGKLEGEEGEEEFVFNCIDPKIGLVLNGKCFHLLRYHFHSPSEHSINDKHWPLEVHVVHQNVEDKLYAILGIMVEPGKGRPATNSFFSDLFGQRKYSANERTPVTYDPLDLLPIDRGDFYRYEGSLTTKRNGDNPETVSWLIFRETLKVSPKELEDFIKHKHEAKSVQPPSRRFVLCNFVPSQT